ncbi:MAG: ABC transporter substrate-binding protein [Actinomycetes bacterium]
MIRSRTIAATAALCLGATVLPLVAGSGALAGAASTPVCSPKALASSKGPVTINFWESMPRANGEEMVRLTDAFNASQKKVHVNLVVQTSYQETFQKYRSALSTGLTPDLAMLTDTDTQAAIDTQSFIPAQTCMSAAGFKTGDLLPRALAYWKVNKVQWGMPFGVSGPVLYYNKKAFTAAGLDPTKPPATLSQLVSTAKVLKAKTGAGMGMVLDPWHLFTWMATGNQLSVNNSNGRTSRANKASFNSSAGLAVFNALAQMKKDGSVQTNSVQGASRYDNLLGAGSGKFSMTIDTSAAQGTIEQLLATGQYPNVDVGVAPMPKVFTTSSKGGVEPAGNGLWISKRSTPAKQAAAWQYEAYLLSASTQAAWSAGTGYIPLRTSAANSPSIKALWAKNPGFKVAYTQLTKGTQDAATAGAVIGPFEDVNGAIANAEASIFVKNIAPKTAINAAVSASNGIIAAYNKRLGVK